MVILRNLNPKFFQFGCNEMTCGCASESIGYEGYRQYLESQCKFCPVCNRIFCLEHAKIHSRLKHLKGKRMRNLP